MRSEAGQDRSCDASTGEATSTGGISGSHISHLRSHFSLPFFALLVAIALTLWLWPSIFGGKVLMPLDILAHNPPHEPAAQAASVHNGLIADMLWENLAWKTFQRKSIAAGELPLWNPGSFCGHPLYATGQASTFYPPNAMFWVMPTLQAYVAFTWLHLWLGGLFMYLFLRRIGVGGLGACAGGLMFAMAGFFAVRFIWPMLLGSAIWLPLMLLWVDRAFDPPGGRMRGRELAAAPLLFALPILSGFLEIAFYAFVACALYTLWLTGRELIHRRAGRAVRAAGTVLGVTLLAAALSAVQLLPFFEVMKLNVRAGQQTYQDALGGSLVAREATTLLVPDALGDPSDHEWFDLGSRTTRPIKSKSGDDFFYFGPKNYVCTGYYFGWLPLSFALLALGCGRKGLFFWALLLFSLLLAFGTPLYRLFFDFVPGADQVRTPFRWMYPATFAGMCLAAMGAQGWYERLCSPAPRRFGRVVAVALVIIGMLGLATVLWTLLRPDWIESLASSILRSDKAAGRNFNNPAELAGLIWVNAFKAAVWLAVALLLLALAWLRAWPPRAAAALGLAALATIALDLGLATGDFNTHADPGLLKSPPPIVQHMQADSGQFRIGRLGWQKNLYPNSPSFYGLQDYGGYDSIILTSFARFMATIEPQKLLMYNIIMNIESRNALDSPLLPLLNLRYLLATAPFEHPDWQKLEVPGNLHLYRIRPERELPRAFLVKVVLPAPDLETALAMLGSGAIDVRTTAVWEAGGAKVITDDDSAAVGTAEITSYANNLVSLRCSTEGRRVLVLCDVQYPGWRAYVNGSRADILTVDGVFRGVCVPAGDSTVEFRYQPASFRLGAAVTLACLGGLVILGFLARRRSRTPAAPALTQL